jgi:hypothetical protein
LILFATTFAWFWRFRIFGSLLLEAREWVLHGSPTQIENVELLARRAGFILYDLIQLLLKNYGHDLLFASLSVLAVFIVLRRILAPSHALKGYEVPVVLSFGILTVLSLLSLLYTPLAYLGSYGTPAPSLRLFCLPLVFSAVLNGLIFHEQISRLKGRRREITVAVLTLILITSAMIGVFSSYRSPYLGTANDQVTRMDMQGMKTFYGVMGQGVVFYIDSLPYGTLATLFGFDIGDPGSIPNKIQQLSYAPAHFGYDEGKSLGHVFNSTAYLPITGFSKAVYEELWPVQGRFTLKDFGTLASDPAATKLYCNGELEIWMFLP